MTTSCCMSRKTPSPDGLAPRPAQSSPAKLHRKAPQDYYFPSLSTASRLSKPEAIIDLQAIFEEDRDSPPEHVQNKKSTTTLKEVATKLRQRLSRDSGISKRHSRSSIGTSEEEIERRAELRRIRHKRIQEELSNEGLYDEDAQSLSTGTRLHSGIDLDTPRDRGGLDRGLPRGDWGSWVPGDTLPLPSLPLPALDLPPVPWSDLKGKSLEERFYGLTSSGEVSPVERRRSEADLFTINTVLEKSNSTRSRRYSSPPPFTPVVENQELILPRPRRHSELPPIPTAPILQAMRLPSIADPETRLSWRLSFASPNRGDNLRKLSRGTFIPNALNGDKLAIGPEPANRWMHSQGLRPASQALTISEDGPELDQFGSHYLTCSASQDFGGVDGPEDTTQDIHLNDMHISQRLASSRLQSVCSSPNLSIQKSRPHARGLSNATGTSALTHQTRSHALNMTDNSDSDALSQLVPPAWGKVVEDGGSSFYPSKGNSIQPSTDSAPFDLLSYLSDVKSTSPKESGEHKDSEVSQALLNELSAISLGLPNPNFHRCPTVDSSCTGISETNSYHAREAELKVVKSRFPDTGRRVPTTPVTSKFREEFDIKPIQRSPSTPTKRSTFARLARLAVKSYDGPMEKMLGVPLPPALPTPRTPATRAGHTPNPVNPLIDSDAAGAWGKAVYLNTHHKTKDVALNLSIPTKDKGRKKSNIVDEVSIGGLFPVMPKRATTTSKSPSAYDEMMSDRDDALDDWERELNMTAQKAKAKSRTIVEKAKLGPDRRYPATWSRYPSHTREERVRAGTTDRVEQKDFAVQRKKEGRTVWFHSERKNHLYHHDSDEHESHQTPKRGFLVRLEEIFKEKKSRAEIKQEAQAHSILDQAYGRRGSLTLSKALEYPELEILPVEVMGHDDLERHVEAMEEEEELRRKEDELDAIFGGPPKKVAADKAESVSSGTKSPPVKSKARSRGLKQKGISGDPTSSGENIEMTPMPEIRVGSRPLSLNSQDSSEPVARASKKIPQVMAPLPTSPEAFSETGLSLKITGKQTAEPVVEEQGNQGDSTGMNAFALEEQIQRGQELRKKMEEKGKIAERGGTVRRGPRARVKLEDSSTGAVDGSAATQTVDGSVDEYDSVEVETSEEDEWEDENEDEEGVDDVSSPRYYADCLKSAGLSPLHRSNSDLADEDKDSASLDSEADHTTLPLDLKPGIGTRQEKFKTWSGRDWDAYCYQEIEVGNEAAERIKPGTAGRAARGKSVRKVKSIAQSGPGLGLRRSTLDFGIEVERAAGIERERMVKLAESAWGERD